MEKVKNVLEEAYGFTVYEEKEEGSRTFLTTDNGAYYLYACAAVHRHKRHFLERVKKHLARRAGLELLPIAPTREGKPYVVADGDLYYLQPAVREALPEDAEYETGRALASFHAASNGFAFSGSAVDRLFQPYRFLGSWPGAWRKKLRRYETYRDDIYLAEAEPTLFDEYLLTTFTYVHHLADTAIRYLTDNGYHRIAGDAARLSKISYQNFDDGYILFKEDGGVCVGGEWEWVIDMRARDVGQWIKARVRRGGWDEKAVQSFLAGYHSISPLSEAEHAMVYGLLLYPGRFLRLVDVYAGLTQEEREAFAAHSWQDEIDVELAKAEEAARSYPRLLAEGFGIDIPQVDWLRRAAQQ